MPHSSDRSLAVDAALAGAAVVRAAFGRTTRHQLKGSVNPVSDADRAAEAAIVAAIGRHRPDDGILAEESGQSGDPATTRLWIIDPLDGTVNFLHGFPHVAVSVALWIDGVPTAGAVVDVMQGEVFSAAAGAGATLDQTPISVSTHSNLDECIVGTGFPYDRDVRGEAYATTLGRVLTKVQGVRRQGAAALDFAWVACGRLDGYWEFGPAPWDVAAGLLLVHEAGGVSADLTTSPAPLESTAYIVSNAALGSKLIDLVRKEAPEHVRSPN